MCFDKIVTTLSYIPTYNIKPMKPKYKPIENININELTYINISEVCGKLPAPLVKVIEHIPLMFIKYISNLTSLVS